MRADEDVHFRGVASASEVQAWRGLKAGGRDTSSDFTPGLPLPHKRNRLPLGCNMKSNTKPRGPEISLQPA